MRWLRSMAGFLTVLLCAALLIAAIWFWMGRDARKAEPDGILVLENGEAAEAFAAPADVLLLAAYSGGEEDV